MKRTLVDEIEYLSQIATIAATHLVRDVDAAIAACNPAPLEGYSAFIEARAVLDIIDQWRKRNGPDWELGGLGEIEDSLNEAIVWARDKLAQAQK